MKKGFWMSLVAAFVLSLTLVACGGIDKKGFYGVWELSGINDGSNDTSSEQLKMLKSYGMNVFLTLNEDGTGTTTMFGKEEKGTWEATSATEATYTTTKNNEKTTSKIVIKDDKLTMSNTKDGVTDTMTFSKTTKEDMDKYFKEHKNNDLSSLTSSSTTSNAQGEQKPSEESSSTTSNAQGEQQPSEEAK